MARSSDSIFPLSLLRDRTFQASEVRRAMAVAGMYLVISTLLVGAFYGEVLERLVEGQAPLLFVSEDITLVEEAVPALGSLLARWVVVMLGINVIVTVGLGLYLSRRLGAPLLAIKRSLRELGAGNLDVQLRASDTREFGEIADALSDAVASIRKQLAQAKDEVAVLDRRDGDGERRHHELELALRNCREALDYFQIDADDAANDADGNTDRVA